MEKRATSEYIWLGSAVRYLLDADETSNVGTSGGVAANIDAMNEELGRLGLDVSHRVLTGWTNVLELREELSLDDEDARLTTVQANQLRADMRHLWRAVMGESAGIYAFVVSEKRLSAEKLLEAVPELFAPGVFDAMPELAQYDFGQAGRCVAFELPTAAAFHLMRGTEGVLKDFYCSVVKRQRVALMWGPMVDHLRARRVPPPAALLDHLDSIRKNFRNPTQHPDATYDIHEAQDLFSVCVDVVNRAIKARDS